MANKPWYEEAVKALFENYGAPHIEYVPRASYYYDDEGNYFWDSDGPGDHYCDREAENAIPYPEPSRDPAATLPVVAQLKTVQLKPEREDFEEGFCYNCAKHLLVLKTSKKPPLCAACQKQVEKQRYKEK